MGNEKLLNDLLKRVKKETEYPDFINRRDFINQTGVFVTPEYFGYIYEYSFKESGVTAEEFVRDYEEKYSTCITEMDLKGVFKYELDNDCLSCLGEYTVGYEPNIWEIVDCLARELSNETQRKEELVEEYKKVLEEAMATNQKFMNLLNLNR